MFKFGFSEDKSIEDENTTEDTKLDWFPAVEIKLPEKQIECKLNDVIDTEVCGTKLKLRRSDNVVLNLKNDEHKNIITAEAQHSDLVPSIYEGGLKIWECSYDLINYLITQGVPLENKRVLDLGCGAGILGILCLLKGSIVHFQDYNSEVIRLVTIPNVQLNLEDELVKEKCEFYSGDWAAFTELSSQKYQDEDEKYDIILSSETIYNPDNQEKLYQVFKRRLKTDGIGIVAGKTYYFGVGGGMRQFETLVVKDNEFDAEQVWKSEEGLQREILKLTRRTN